MNALGFARIKIGAWTASPALNLLERDAQSIRIETRAMDVLMVLAGQPGAVVPVEELLATVWKGVVVGEGSVYLAIRQLRQVFEDSAEGTRYIETIPKRGYRLIVPVEPLEAEPPPAAASVSSAPSPRRFGRIDRRWLAAAAVAGVAIVLAIAFACVSARRPLPQPRSPFCRSTTCLPIPSRSTSPTGSPRSC